MAISQSVSRFFLPNLRRSRPRAGGGKGFDDAASQQILASFDQVIDQTLESFNAPKQVASFMQGDLEAAFRVVGPRPPGYTPGAARPLEVNLLDLARDPVQTTWKVIKTPFDTKLGDTEAMGDAFLEALDEAVWDHLLNNVLVDEGGNAVIPYSTRVAIDRWNKRKGKVEVLRDITSKAVRQNPGVGLMMSESLQRYNPNLVINGTSIGTFAAEARKADAKVTEALKREKKDVAEGRITQKQLDEKWKDATDGQTEWVKSRGDDQKELTANFEKAIRTDRDFAATPEARAWRFWKSRDLHQQTLHVLRTWKRDGVWGVVRDFGWKKTISKSKYWYGKHLKEGIDNIAEKLGVKKLLGALGGIPGKLKQLKATYWVKKGAGWLIKKLGLGRLIGGILGSALPFAGTALGAIIGAVVQFVGEIVVEKLGGVGKIVGYTLAGALGFFVVLGIGIITLFSIVLSDNPYPWQQGGSAAFQRFVQIEVKACDSAAGCSYQNPLRVSNGQHSISWRVVIKSISSQPLNEASFTFSQEQCSGRSRSGFILAPGQQITAVCSSTFNETDEVVSNVVSFSSGEPIANEESVGIVIFGNPPVVLPTGWPVASGCLNQGPDGSFSHSGTEAIDIGTGTGTAVRATFNGVVQQACWKFGPGGCNPDGLGNYVRLSSLDGSFSASFGHLASVSVDPGDPVTVGQQLGTVDSTGFSTGAHLHYEFSSLPMAEPYIPRDTGSNGSIRGCNIGECGLCF